MNYMDGLFRKAIRLSIRDNVFIAVVPLHAGDIVEGISVLEDIPAAHKGALCDIQQGEIVYKYGAPIGKATRQIHAGEHVHIHNLSSMLGSQSHDCLADISIENISIPPVGAFPKYFQGYRRWNGEVGIRNQLWIIPTVGCVNSLSRRLAQCINQERNWAEEQASVALEHPYGCSQQGTDHVTTRKILARLALHPNAGGVLIVSLGCENNTLEGMLKEMEPFDPDRVKWLVVQQVQDEYKEGMKFLRVLADQIEQDQRVDCPVESLKIGLKCGGSDAFSGITANPVVGMASDMMNAAGIRLLMGEVPEMFGGEHVLLSQSCDPDILARGREMILSYKDYFINRGCPPDANPSPGNKAGGITTLEEKSLGCVRKAGRVPIRAILEMAEPCVQSGLSLVRSPGNDAVAVTLLAAAGAQLILFTTGRGTPLGSVVPTLKISSTSQLAMRKPHWIDFDAGAFLSDNYPMNLVAQRLVECIFQIIQGVPAKNEQNDDRNIAIFKDGITL